MIAQTDIAYLAGLFDGEGNIQYKQYMRKRRNNEKAYPTWSIRMEVSMTDESVIRYIHQVLGVGTVSKRPPHKTSMGKKMQYRWRCGFRDAYYVCRLFWPYAHVKLPQIQKIVDHYIENDEDKKVVNLKDYMKWRKK